jgi:Ca2+-binding EF-hand superfamily protein
MKVAINDNETRALFNRLDADHDGNITNQELYDAINSYSGNVGGSTKGYDTSNNQMNNILMRIANGAEKARTVEDFVIAIFRRFDMN